jgi:hypothetical protein
MRGLAVILSLLLALYLQSLQALCKSRLPATGSERSRYLVSS